MSRTYSCDAADCENVVSGVPIEVTYYTPDEDDDEDPDYNEAHFCSWACLSAWATGVALDFPPEPA